MFFTSKNEDNVVSVVYRILRLLKVKVTLTSVIEYLIPHPNYPSLKSVCDLLNYIHVDNYPIRIDETELHKLNTPFIAHLNDGQGKIILIRKINNRIIYYADSRKGYKILATDKFLKIWSKTVILIDPSEKSGEFEYSQKSNTELVKNSILPFTFILFITAIVADLLTKGVIIGDLLESKSLLIALSKSTGLLFSLLLFRTELNIRTKFTDKLCHLSNKTDCNAITKSKASKIFGGISWADIGIVYFAGGLILLSIFPSESALTILFILSIASLPFPLFSILYQWLKIRKWCLLCISVQVVVLIEFFLLFNKIYLHSLKIPMLLIFFTLYGTVFIIVLLIKLLYIALKENEHTKLSLKKLKRDPEIFKSKLEKAESVEIPENKYSLILGDKSSNVTITVFLSFYCSSCAKKFREIRKLIENKTEVRIQLAFPISKDDLSSKLLGIIYSMQISGFSDEILDMLSNWYDSDTRLKQKLLDKYKTEYDSSIMNELVEYHSKLFQSNKIVLVPSVYVNGYSLPENYELEDIKYFLDILGKTKNEISTVEV